MFDNKVHVKLPFAVTLLRNNSMKKIERYNDDRTPCKEDILLFVISYYLLFCWSHFVGVILYSNYYGKISDWAIMEM